MITILSPLDYHLLPIKASPNAKCVAIAIKSDEIIGQLEYHEIPHLGNFYVKKEYQRQGIGAALLDRMELIVPEYYTFPSTLPAAAFFRRRGLKQMEELQVYAKFGNTPR